MTRAFWNRHFFAIIGLLIFGAVKVNAQSIPTILADVDHRQAIGLNGDWHTIIDPYFDGLYTFHHEIRNDGYFLNEAPRPGSNKLLEYDFSKSPTLRVPGDWNSQREMLSYYEGMIWYQRDFDYQPREHYRTFFHIGAANYKAILWVNGSQVCMHEGGFTPFDCEVTKLLHPGKNFAVVAVDDTRQADGVPTQNTDWFNFGGLTRDVSLVDVPERFIDDYDLHLNLSRTAIEGWVHVQDAAPGASVSVSIPELHLESDVLVDSEGRGAIKLAATGLQFWSPDQPKLYRVTLKFGKDLLEDDIGFRTVEVSGTKILLNGKPVFLRGISIHAEAPYRGGRANNDEDVATLLKWARELGCNYVRLAHYPHDQRMTRATDRLGFMVWSEIPVYWAEHFGNPAVLKNAEQQLSEEIRRDRNKASILLWSIANETPNTPERTQFLKTLAKDARALDSTRLVTAALLVRTEGHIKYVDDALGEALDVIGANEYIGWYEQNPEDADTTVWKIAYDKPLIISEFGGDAKAGLHGPETQRWTEEYQASIFKHQLPMLNRIPQLRGLSPWILMDFRSPRRQLPGIQDGFNRKGLISNHGEKKQAFYLLQKAYKQESIGKAE
ncbi:MAG: glycoside hydrolase family 2 TIM barrel-domain containing protein [Terracidiphilus sp.]